MKALFINGGPRKNWTTAKMLENAMKGAVDAGAEVEMIHLYDHDFHGCKSCFACKIKGSRTNGVCAVRDQLRPVLEKCHEADVLVIGSPIYFSYPTGDAIAFMQRLLFPVLSYNPSRDEATGETKMTLMDRIVPTAMIYTMGASKEYADQAGYPSILGENEKFLKLLFGYCETLCSYSGYQFDDYSRYDVMEDVQQMRAQYRDEQFPLDLQKAHELGKRLAEMAR